MKENTISLCMIVKDEQDMLEACLQSVQGIVDEIVIVDTGSTDNTKEIAERYGAKLYDYVWNSDFASARNFAIEQATSKWILQLDADEYVQEASKKRFHTFLDTSGEHALSLQILNYDDESSSYTVHRYPRIYRNLPSIRYQGKIHEQLAFKGEILDFQETDLQLIHLGYTKEVVKKKNKVARNIRILQMELKDKPNDPFIHFNLGNEMMKTKDYKKAIKYYQTAHSSSQNFTIQSSSLLNLLRALMRTKQEENALRILQDAEINYPDYTDLFFVKGEILEGLGRDSEATEAYLHCLQLGETPKKYLTISGIGYIYPLEQLTKLAIASRDFKRALGYMTEVNELLKYGTVHATRMVHILLHVFNVEKVIAFIHEMYPTENEKDQRMKAYLAHHFRLYDYFQQAIEVAGDSLTETDQRILLFYRGLDTSKAKELAIEFSTKAHTRVYAFIYYLLTKDPEVREALSVDKTCIFLLSELDGSGRNSSKKTIYKKSLYIHILKELMHTGRYELLGMLLPVAGAFEQGTYAEIGDLFSTYHQDDLAIEYYTKQLLTKKDATLYTKTANLLYHQGMYHEALLFAEKANKLNPHHFKAIEILLESCQQLNEKALEKQLIETFLHMHPDSAYLLSKKEA